MSVFEMPALLVRKSIEKVALQGSGIAWLSYSSPETKYLNIASLRALSVTFTQKHVRGFPHTRTSKELDANYMQMKGQLAPAIFF